jgi:hypothetical protein
VQLLVTLIGTVASLSEYRYRREWETKKKNVDNERKADKATVFLFFSNKQTVFILLFIVARQVAWRSLPFLLFFKEASSKEVYRYEVRLHALVWNVPARLVRNVRSCVIWDECVVSVQLRTPSS